MYPKIGFTKWVKKVVSKPKLDNSKMGIRGLMTLIKRKAPGAISYDSYESFRGKKIAVDSSILLYKYKFFCIKGDKNAHIKGFMKKTLKFLQFGITPVFVFDGKPPEEKSYALNRRSTRKSKIIEKITFLEEKLDDPALELEDIRKIRVRLNKLKGKLVWVSREERDEIKEVLGFMGIPVVEAVGEAEATCLSLKKCGEVDYVYSDDTDVLALGCPEVLRTTHDHNNAFMRVDLEGVLRGLGMSMDTFVDMCILCGCDYSPVVNRVSSDKAYNLLKDRKKLEKIYDDRDLDLIFPDGYSDTVKVARRMLKFPVTFGSSTSSLDSLYSKNSENSGSSGSLDEVYPSGVRSPPIVCSKQFPDLLRIEKFLRKRDFEEKDVEFFLGLTRKHFGLFSYSKRFRSNSQFGGHPLSPIHNSNSYYTLKT